MHGCIVVLVYSVIDFLSNHTQSASPLVENFLDQASHLKESMARTERDGDDCTCKRQPRGEGPSEQLYQRTHRFLIEAECESMVKQRQKTSDCAMTDCTEREAPITAIEMRPIHLWSRADNYTNFCSSLPIQIDSHKGGRIDVMKHSHCQVRSVKARVLAAGKSQGMAGKCQRLANCATTDFMLEMKPIHLTRCADYFTIRYLMRLPIQIGTCEGIQIEVVKDSHWQMRGIKPPALAMQTVMSAIANYFTEYTSKRQPMDARDIEAFLKGAQQIVVSECTA